MGKRVRAARFPIRRAPDGSAFQKCDECGVTVAVALWDMHDCNMKKDVKRVKVNPKFNEKHVYEEPRSAFLFFMESYAKSSESRGLIEINREAFQKWKNMSKKEQSPYVEQAQKVEIAYMNAIYHEEIQSSQGDDDEADSATVQKFAQHYEDFEDLEDYHSGYGSEF